MPLCTDYASLEIPVDSCIASTFSRQIAIGNAGPASALDSMGGKRQCPKLSMHPAPDVHIFRAGCTILKGVHPDCAHFFQPFIITSTYKEGAWRSSHVHCFMRSAPGGCTIQKLNFGHCMVFSL